MSKSHLQSTTVEYHAWTAMKQRCTNPRSHNYHNYGGRGITVCDRWLGSFEAFLADMGKRPSPDHSLDRIDVNGNYEPGNCRWATTKEQHRNRRDNKLDLVKVAGIRRRLSEGATLIAIAREYGVSWGIIRDIRNGEAWT